MYKKKQEKLNFDFLLSPMLFSFLKEKASDSTDNQTAGSQILLTEKQMRVHYAVPF